MVTRYATPRAFLDAVEPFLLQAEVENNLILGITRAIVADPLGLMARAYFATVSGRASVCMAAFQTVPGRLAITATHDADAVDALCRDVHEACPEVDAVIGPDSTVAEFSRGLAMLRGMRAELHVSQRIHGLTRVESLSALPPGALRLARLEEAPCLVEWLAAFQVEIGEPADARRVVTSRMAAGQLYVWDQEGPRSMAGWSGKTPNGVRVNAVYTPPELRGRGYATATVAVLSQLLLDQGNRFCCLYTDLANPTSNAIYKRIGYQAVSDSSVYRIVRREA